MNGTGGGGAGGYGQPSSYNGGAGGSGIVIVQYLYSPPAPPTSNITFISQTPTTITSSNLASGNLSISYNISNITSGTPVLSYKTNTTSHDYGIIVNGTAIVGYTNTTGTNVSSVFNFTLDNHEVYPSTNTLNHALFENTTHQPFNLPNGTSVLSTELLNVSNSSAFSFLMLMANGSTASPIRYYYCNSSYDFASNAFTSPNCALFGSIPANTPPNVSHMNTSYLVVPMPLNASSGTILGTTVKVSPNSYILIRGANAAANSSAWYINQTTRPTTTKSSTNSGASWTNQTFTEDLHLHQFDSTELFSYQVFANVSGALNNSSITSQTITPQPQPPTAPLVLTPTAGNKYGIINISWTAAQNLTPATLYYNVSLLNTDLSFNKTIIGNTSNLSYAWNSAGTPQAAYVIQVMAIENDSFNSSDVSDQFNVATFNTTAIIPTSGQVFAGNAVAFSYSTTPVFASASCDIRVDGGTLNTQAGLAGTFNATLNLSDGSHTWVVNCSDTEGAGYSFQTASRSFDIHFSSFNNVLNLTNSSENVLASPQAMFYDVNGSLNVLYFTDDPGGNTLWIKTIQNNQVVNSYNASLAATTSFFMAMRQNGTTVLLTFNASAPTQPIFITLNGGISIAAGTFPNAAAGTNVQYDPYTYANSMQFTSLALNGSSYYFFAVPIGNGTGFFKVGLNNTTITQVGNQFNGTAAPAWQTMANDSGLSTWYYLQATNTSATSFNISLGYYNGTDQQNLKVLDNGYNATQLNGSIGNFYEYGGIHYAMLSNLANTTIYDIEDDRLLTLNESLSSPSFLFFVDSRTFLFFNRAGGATSAYSCYFGTTGNCTKLSASDYGITMPYDRGTMATEKRDGGNDVVARGIIQETGITQLYYNLNTYDGKYLCLDEMAETRDVFTVSIYTNTTSNILLNQSWGYVIPSASLGSGLIKSYFLCQTPGGINGTLRLFLSGLTSNFTIDAYSLQLPKGTYYTFQVLNQYNIPISGAQMTAYRFSNAKQAFVPIEQGITDFNGNAQFFLEAQQFYKFLIQADGYVVLNFDFTPGAITSLTVRLNQQGGTVPILPDFEQVFNDVSYSLLPADSYHNESFNITYTVSSNSSSLQYFGMNITRSFNGTDTLVFSSNVSSASGGTMQYLVSQNGTYYVYYWFKHQNFTQYSPLPKQYSLFPQTGLASVRANIGQQINGWAYFFFASLIALLAAGWAIKNAGFSADGAGAFGVAVLWVMAILNPNALVLTAPAVPVWMATTALTLLVLGGLLWKQYAA